MYIDRFLCASSRRKVWEGLDRFSNCIFFWFVRLDRLAWLLLGWKGFWWGPKVCMLHVWSMYLWSLLDSLTYLWTWLGNSWNCERKRAPFHFLMFIQTRHTLQCLTSISYFHLPSSTGSSRGEPEACGLGQHVWVSESGSSPWMAMVVGDHEAELSLRRIGRGEERGSFRVARQRLRSAEDGRSCTESRSVEKLKVKVRGGQNGTTSPSG